MANGSAQHRYYTLLTGATGLLGRYLLKDLLLAGHRVAVVARNSKKQTAAERIEEICTFWESELNCDLPRPVVLTGDVRQKNLGLSDADYRWVARHCDSCFHNAAILNFCSAPRNQEPWVTNLGGTIQVVDLCTSLEIDNFHYVSTAYVCGNRNDRILENELDRGQEFRNHYEQSKFEAEQYVANAAGLKKVTIYRPAVITADSRTGYTTTYHGLHLYLRLMSLLVPQVEPDENGIRHTKIRLPMTGDEQRNVVSVDWVSNVMCHLFGNANAHGRVFHLSPDHKLTPRQLIESCYKYFHSAGVEFCANRDPNDSDLGEFEKNFLSNVGIYHSYDRSDPIFDTENLKRFAGDILCPEIDESTIHRFLEFGELDRWGKKRNKVPRANFQIANHLHSLKDYAFAYRASLPNGHLLNGSFKLGFDIVGRGGGQWHFDGQSGQVKRGLPREAGSYIVRIDADSMQRHLLATGNFQQPFDLSVCEPQLAD